MQVLICFLAGYLSGCILTAVIVCRLRTGKDVSDIGSGNPGMANVMSNIGKREGIIVLAGDILKVIFACLLAWLVTWSLAWEDVVLYTGFAALLGHNYPFWRKFRGGKGVAVTCIWLFLLMPAWGSISCAAGGIITLVTGYLPLGGVLIPVIAIPFAFLSRGEAAGILVALCAIISVQKHWGGLKRVFKGEERRRFH